MEIEWTAIGAGIAAVLALVGSVFSALGAAKSADLAKRMADVAEQAEQRARVAQEVAGIRELNRSVAHLGHQNAGMKALAMEWNTLNNALSTMTAAPLPPGHKTVLAEFHAHVDSVAKFCESFSIPTTPTAVDEALVDVDKRLAEQLAMKEHFGRALALLRDVWLGAKSD